MEEESFSNSAQCREWQRAEGLVRWPLNKGFLFLLLPSRFASRTTTLSCATAFLIAVLHQPTMGSVQNGSTAQCIARPLPNILLEFTTTVAQLLFAASPKVNERRQRAKQRHSRNSVEDFVQSFQSSRAAALRRRTAACSMLAVA